MQIKRIHLLLFAACCCFYTVRSQNLSEYEQLGEVVISATKFNIKKALTGKIIYKIDSVQLSNSKGMTLIEILDKVAGIHIQNNNGAAGKNKGIYLRGGRDRQVIVLVDGIAMNDPSGIHTTFDLRLIAVNQIASIEIMNGAASTLYGSGAATGIINITLKEAADKPIDGNLNITLGTNKSHKSKYFKAEEFKQQLTLRGSLDRFNYVAALSNARVSGLSEAASEVDLIFEKDPWNSVNSYVKLGYELSSNWNLHVFNNYDRNTYDYDAGGYQDSFINNGETEQFRLGLRSLTNLKKGIFSFLISQNRISRNFDSYNSWTAKTDHFEYRGKTLLIEATLTYDVTAGLKMIGGLNFQKLQNDTDTPYGAIDDKLAHYQTVDPYVLFVWNTPSGFNLNIGSRLNMHSEYGSHWVFNLNPSFNVSEKFRLLGGYSTAFIAPSTYQLFSQYGNVNLKPEEDLSLELGAEFYLTGKFSWNSLFFYREEENAIKLPDFITYINTAEKIVVKGIESQVTWNFMSYESIKLGHTYINKDQDLDYIPSHKLTLGIETKRFKNSFLSISFRNISKRTYYDQWGTGDNIELKAYSLTDFYGSHTFNGKKLTAFVHVQNILNEKYVETIGYSTKGRNFRVGLSYDF